MSEIPGSDYIVFAIFCTVVGATVAGGLIAAFSTRIIRGVVGLMLCALGLAGLYYFLGSPFIALMEVLIYVGAVCVTIVFAVMLAEPAEPAVDENRGRVVLWGGSAVLVSALIFAGIVKLVLDAEWVTPANRITDGSVQAIGISLLTTYSMAFELISIVLLVAILGALVIARMGRTKE